VFQKKLLEFNMPRGCDPVSQSQTYLVNLGTTTQTVSMIGARDGSLPTRNTSIVSDRATPVRKIPRKAASFFLPAKSDMNQRLPDHHSSTAPETERERFRRKPGSKSFRAAENGKGDVLPTSIPSPAGMSRTLNPSNLHVPMWNRRRGLSSSASSEQQFYNNSSVRDGSLRSRRNRTLQLDDFDKMHSSNHSSHTWSDMDPSSRIRKSYLRRDFSLSKLLMSLKPVFLLQVVVVLAVTFLVWDSHHKALLTTEKLHQFRHSESMLMLHLQRIEQQSIHLHENLIQLQDGSSEFAGLGSPKQKASPATVDSDLIRKQMQQLQQMEEELEHEVRSLQTKIKKSARNSIIHSYGEGPVQVVLEVDIGDTKVSGESIDDEKEDSKRISIILWHDTPHAAWTWLQQIESGAWNNVPWEVDRGLSIEAAVSPLSLPEDGSKLQFVEKAQKGHEAWTVGFSNMEGGGSGIFINLKDNSHYHRHEVCVGKVLDGFSVLQKLVEVSRKHGQTADGPPIRIKSATASHLTRKDIAGL
jgi:cyclophilin family peptidyl-prolyl cis-trans isomerase/cell division protein FtsB